MEGDRREAELKERDNIVKQLIQHGATLMRHDGGLDSARRILEQLLQKPDDDSLTLSGPVAGIDVDVRARVDKLSEEVLVLRKEFGGECDRVRRLLGRVEEERVISERRWWVIVIELGVVAFLVGIFVAK